MNVNPKFANYHKVALHELSKIDESGVRPKLLLHVCCGPCSCFPLLFLCPHLDVTIYYSNSNIYPESEYQKRLRELKRFLEFVKKDYGYNIPLIEMPYDNEDYMKHLTPFGPGPEGGERCFACYAVRMKEAYDYAEANGFDYFTTVMTISRQKNAEKLNEIGMSLSTSHPHTKYFYSDFKKGKGEEEGIRIAKSYDLYRQCYCGCVYSYEDMLRRNELKAVTSDKK